MSKMKLVFDWISRKFLAEKYNPFHHPAGSPLGGRFAPKSMAGAAGVTEVPYRGSRVHQLLVKKGLAKTWERKEKPKSGVSFANPEHQKTYDEALAKYRELSPEKLLETWKTSKDVGRIRSIMETWKAYPGHQSCIAFKQKAKEMEGMESNARVKSKTEGTLVRKELRKIPDKEYLRARAMGQAYMEKTLPEEVTLFRGVDGSSGKEMKAEIKGSTTKSYTLNESPLVGYSDKLQVSHGFGAAVGGITVKRSVKRDEIIFPPKFINDLRVNYEHEPEYIVKHASPLKINRSDIMTST